MRTELLSFRRQLTIAIAALVARRQVAALALLAGLAVSGVAAAEDKARATHPNGETALVVEFDVKPGSEADFEDALRRLAVCAQRDPGAIVFNAHKVRGQPGRYTLYEIWRSPEALMAHWRRPYVKNLLKTADIALAKPAAEGGIMRRFISELAPAARTPPVPGDPADDPDCR
ncbi:MAG: antibiotic biosynthesis monooxygenase family protein [Hyphomicrobiales bacterium]|nr:antibiotic biosynthesis monooxygenase family protein [Hyphomicrobiales bacterium]